MSASLVRASFIAFVLALTTLVSAPAFAETKAQLDRNSAAALKRLIAKVPAAKALNEKAVAVLVFTNIKKAGLVIGGQYGEGVLWRDGKPAAYYSTAGVSYGLQAGAQKFGYAMFFMRESALEALNTADGWEVGVGPSIVVVDDGWAKSATTQNASDDIYAFIFSQKGLMAGLGVQGNKVTKLDK